MGTYLYAITAAGHPLRLSGLGGVGDPAAQLRTVSTKDLCAVVSDAPPGLRAKRRDVAAHQGVQERLLADGAVLPMRFGLVGADDAEVTAALEQDRDSYLRRLAETDGCREYHLKVARDEDDLLREIMRESAEVRRMNDHTRQNPGAHDKMALGELIAQEVQTRQEQGRSDIVARLGRAVVRTAESTPTKQHFLTVSFLVERTNAAAFAEAVHAEAERLGDSYTFSLHGPLPPYSFV
ncbi:GvpL/GvpF family gas vesicle protein [Streptomyces sp. NPDC048611]|uniref:GvpL/GvpF family gas vesicle protein n=1 Tax=unclassified Streptomyces TaxID=2593676 RepID=UPI0034186618